MNNGNSKLQDLKLLLMEQVMENSSRIVYHDMGFCKRIESNVQEVGEAEKLSEEEIELIYSSVYVYTYCMNHLRLSKVSTKVFLEEFANEIKKTGPVLMSKANFTEAEIDVILLIMDGFGDRTKRKGVLNHVFNDALTLDFVGKNGKNRLELFYKEVILNDLSLSLKKFYELLIDFLGEYEAHTEFSKIHIKPNISKLILELEKEQSKIYKRKEIILKKELDIDDEELKELRKNLKSVKGRDSRGVQTLLRTTSRNHYTLNQMVDRKASIMITVNSIILSIIIGGTIAVPANEFSLLNISLSILSIASLVSIIFAIIAITPNKTQGRFTMDDVRNKKGNLLYYGNFHNMSFKDYEWGMLQKLNDSDYLYGSMIRDIYFLGQTLDRKYKYIRTSLFVFITGMGVSFILSTIYSFNV